MKYYLKLFLRRLPIFMLVTTVISALSIVVALSLPPVFISQARFFIESSQIPTALAPPTVAISASEQMQIFQQSAMNRATILDIARRLNVFPDMDRMSADEIYQRMVKQTEISTFMTKGSVAILKVGFSAANARKAAAVMNEYMSVIQQQDVSARTGRAGQTLEFFQQEVERLSGELAKASNALIVFKTENAAALPDGQSYRLGQQAILQERLAQGDRDISTLRTQRTRLVEIFNATGQVQGIPGAPQTPEQAQLAQARQQLNAAQAVYSPTHPKVKALESRIKQIEAVVAQQVGSAPAGASPLDLQLADIDARIAALEEQKTQTQKTLDEVTAAISRSAANEVQLAGLEREYSNLQTQYNSAVARRAEASTGERIEVLSRGQRLTVIEQPVTPTRPASPNRVLIAGGGTVFGILAGLALVVLIEFLNSAPRRPEAIARKLGVTPLGTLPYLESVAEQRRRRYGSLAMTAAIMVFVPLFLWGIHVYYMPLDILVQKIGKKIGLSL